MKSLTVTYSADGNISGNVVEPKSFEMENSLQIVATFPTMTGVKRAYVKAANGSSHMFVVDDELYPTALTVVGDVATLIIPDDLMVEGTLKIGFENLNGEVITRFKPLGIRIDDFVNLNGSLTPFNYTVTVTVGNVSTLDAGENATFVNVGTAKDVILDVGIPRGANVDIQKSATHIQWKLETSDTWLDLVPLTDLESDEIELQKTLTHIQYRYYYPKTNTYSAWADLVALEDLRGFYFTPSIDENSNVSWTNNGGLVNPETVNIKGDKGDKGDTGAKGDTGNTGIQGDTGDSGVYIGETEPTDANVWIDTTGSVLLGSEAIIQYGDVFVNSGTPINLLEDGGFEIRDDDTANAILFIAPNGRPLIYN